MRVPIRYGLRSLLIAIVVMAIGCWLLRLHMLGDVVVRGRVAYRGQPVHSLSVYLVAYSRVESPDGSIVYAGTTDRDGNFTLMDRTTGIAGCKPGEYGLFLGDLSRHTWIPKDVRVTYQTLGTLGVMRRIDSYPKAQFLDLRLETGK